MASKRDRDDSRLIKRAVLSSKVDSIRVRPYNLDGTFCPHCQRRLSSKTYRKHKMLYYNTTTEIWTTVNIDVDDVSGNYDTYREQLVTALLPFWGYNLELITLPGANLAPIELELHVGLGL